MEIKKKFGEKVKEFRIAKGLSQQKLALNAELDRTYIPSIEKGERNVSLEVIYKLAEALEIDVVEFFK
jgi:transcriptional regulator with XRE-family HTH domain